MANLNLSPSIARLDFGQEIVFSPPPWIRSHSGWFVNGIPGGNDRLGRVDPNGLYTAPSDAGDGIEVTIGLRVSGPRRRWCYATVLVGETGEGFYRYRGYQPLSGSEGFGLKEAHAIAVNIDGRILVADPILSVIATFDQDSGELTPFVKHREGDILDGPRDVEVGADGRVYVADGNNGLIRVFSQEGILLYTFGESKTGERLKRPHSVAVDEEGNVYVADVDASKIYAYDRDGQLLRSWGGPGGQRGHFLAPHGVAVDPNGDIFVAEYDGRCQKFTPDGELVTVFANEGLGKDQDHGERRYHTLTCDHLGNVYLMSRIFGKTHMITVDKYNNDGVFVTSFCPPLSRPFPFGCQDAAVSSSGRVYVADTWKRMSGFSTFDPAR